MPAVESAPAAAAGPAEQMVVIPEREHLRLCTENAYWQSMHARALEREAHLKSEVESLGAKVRDLEKRLYDRKSERKAGKGKGKESGATPPRRTGRAGSKREAQAMAGPTAATWSRKRSSRTLPRIRSSARSAAWAWSRFRARKTPRCWRWRCGPTSA